jgi:hypothetical protein
MEIRDFDEVDLRAMLQRATALRRNVVEGRFVIRTRFRGRAWEVVVEPDELDHLLVIVTAYPVGP